MYGIFLKLEQGKNSREGVIFQALQPDSQGRVYWLGGSNVRPLLFQAKRSATNALKKVKREWTMHHKLSAYRPHHFRIAEVELLIQ